MAAPRFAVIDVETTHGDPRLGRVIEMAVLLHDGMHVVDGWSTFVDPKERVPGFIQRLTGIQREELRGAPTFRQAARMLQGFTRGRTIVAHNARFDMTVLAHEFARVGLSFQRPTLCTEQLGRQVLPGLSHYNLGSLCRHLGIPFEARHRARPDAEATAELFSRLMARCEPLMPPGDPHRSALRRSA